jgi:hypothetical protein
LVADVKKLQSRAEVGVAPPEGVSVIAPDFGKAFSEFRGKRFKFLWRGSRDGFGSNDFHRLCDGHAPTVILVSDTNGNIFGGFTPVAWASEGNWMADDSLASFLFTLKNPHGIPPKKFALNPERKGRAIYCQALWGPAFDDDFVIRDNCSQRAGSSTNRFGRTYVNDTGVDGPLFFTGTEMFTVKEIEIFEVVK